MFRGTAQDVRWNGWQGVDDDQVQRSWRIVPIKTDVGGARPDNNTRSLRERPMNDKNHSTASLGQSGKTLERLLQRSLVLKRISTSF
jgi:hypothetical protein